MTPSVLNGDIMFRKGIFWTIGEHLYFDYYLIISYQMIKVYRVETMDIGIFHWNNSVSRKCNPSNYCGIIIRDDRILWES